VEKYLTKKSNGNFMKEKNLISLAGMEKLIKQNEEIRVSEDAKYMLYRVLMEKSEKISKKAIMFAEHTGRKTIKSKDIRIAKD